MQIPPDKKIYFLSDFHLGAPDHVASLKREKRIIKFLDQIKNDAAVIFVLGDMFDFWYEYKKVVPKGYVRILGKLAELTDSGIIMHFFVGNHDMWMNGYFEKELNIQVYHEHKEFEFNGKKFIIGHGDGLGPGDLKYNFLGEDGEWLISFAKKELEKQHIDYFVFGHRHLPIEFKLPGDSLYVNLGDWIKYFSYGEFDGENLTLKYYPS